MFMTLNIRMYRLSKFQIPNSKLICSIILIKYMLDLNCINIINISKTQSDALSIIYFCFPSILTKRKKYNKRFGNEGQKDSWVMRLDYRLTQSEGLVLFVFSE